MDEAKKRCPECHPNTGAQCMKEEGHAMPHMPAPLTNEQIHKLCNGLMRDVHAMVANWQSYGFDRSIVVGALFGASFWYATEFRAPEEEVRKLLDEAFESFRVQNALLHAPMPAQNAPAPRGVQ